MKQLWQNKATRRFLMFEFLAGMHFFSAVLTPFYTEWGGVSLAAGQLLQSWFTLWIFLLEVPTGVIADKYGCRRSIHLGCLIIALATVIYGSYPHIALFALGEFLFAVGVALMSGADKALFYEHLRRSGLEENAASYWGKVRSVHMAGILVAAPLGSLIAHYLDINFAMVLTSLPTLAAAWIINTVPDGIKPELSDTEKNFFRMGLEGLKFLIHHKILARWTVNSIIVATAAYFIIWLYQPQMKHLSMPIYWYGFAHALLVASEMLISAGHSFLVRLVKTTSNYYKLTAVLISASMIVSALIPHPATLVLLLVIGGGFGLTRAEFMSAEMNRYIESSNRATVNSAASMYRRIVLAVLNPFVGMTTEVSPSLSLGLIGLIPLLALLFPI